MVSVVVSGAINWDINLFLERFPAVGEEVPVRRITRVPGGTAANVAVAAARLLPRGETAFIGALGKDEVGREQVKVLEAEGIRTEGLKLVEGVESGQAYITIDEQGRNCIHTFFGANRELTPEDLIEPARARLIGGAKVIAVTDPPLPVAVRLLELGKTAGAETVWDPGVLAELGLSELAEGLARTDYFILNALEFKRFLGTYEPRRIGEALSRVNRGVKALVKRGGEGSSLVSDAGRQVRSLPAVPLERMGMNVVNTVGCGDAFIGAFAASKAQGYGDLEALRRANAAGAYKATRLETRGSPTLSELEQLLNNLERLGL
ncbi:MAG: PfkB family carbohydrate kinase [Candidatus Bathyarchaeia archaeon]